MTKEEIEERVIELLIKKRGYIQSNKGNWMNVSVSGINYDNGTFWANCWVDTFKGKQGGHFRKVSVAKIKTVEEWKKND